MDLTRNIRWQMQGMAHFKITFTVRNTAWKSTRNFPCTKKETTDKVYHDDPFQVVNFKTDFDGDLVCPRGKKFYLAYRKPVKGNQYGRQKEYYTCEDYSGCPYAS